MRLTVTIHTHYPKHGRDPSTKAIIHDPGTTWRTAAQKAEVALVPKPGRDVDIVAASVFMIGGFDVDVSDDFWDLDREAIKAFVLNEVRQKVIESRRGGTRMPQEATG